MLDPTSALSNIYSVAKLIYAQVQLVKANLEQCKRLAERIGIIEQSVRDLEKIKDKSQYEKGLNDLLMGLQNCLQFMTQLSATSSFVAFFKAGNTNQQFANLNDELQKSMQQLNLGLAAQQVFNREKDKQDQQADIEFIKKNHAEIISQVQKANAGIGQLDLELKENHDIVLNQFASMKALLMGLNRSVEKPPIDPHHVASYFELVFDKKLCAGSFGQIYLGRWRGQVTVIKSIEGSFSEDDKAHFIREVQIMSQCRDKHITQFYGASLEPGRACLLMEHMEHGSLYQVLEKPLSPPLQKQMALEIARGLQYLHTRGILHRDLKSANVLVNADHHAKLSDFGLSQTRATSVKTAKQKSEATRWLPPECFTRGGTYTTQSDIYSYGVILWELATGQRPYAGVSDAEIPDRTVKGKRDTLEGIPEPYASLIKQCWAIDPTKRPTVDHIIQTLEKYTLAPASITSEEHYNQGLKFDQLKDYTHALEFYQKALDKGHVKAGTNMGLFFLLGKSGVPDKAKAYQYFLDSANKGHPRAMTNLAIMLKRGDGIPQDIPEALSWFKKAAKLGDTQAASEAAKLEAVLAPPTGYSLETPHR
jgi:serine/threonine protein kinase